jgi:hypothetical protein
MQRSNSFKGVLGTAMPYHRTQFGTAILVIGVLGVVITWRTAPRSMIGLLIILAAVAVIFNSLTVEIDGHELRW